jgi:hypothetical protein
MGLMLTTNAATVAEVLHGAGEPGEGSVVAAIAATRSLGVIVEDTLKALVFQARSEGRTWAEIGEVLRVSRQAAFQRFGADAPGDDLDLPGGRPLKGATKLAAGLVNDFLSERWEKVEKDFTAKMLEVVPREVLVSTRARIGRQWGALLEKGTARVTALDGFTVVDLPLAFERQDASCRAVFNADGQVAGLLLRPTGVDVG